MSKPNDSPAVDWRKEAEDLGILLNESQKELKALRWGARAVGSRHQGTASAVPAPLQRGQRR